MKIHIIYPFKRGPWGGSNTFSKNLRNYLESIDLYTDIPQETNVFLINSHNNLEEVIRLKQKYPNIKFIHRIDGPMALYNHSSDKRDNLVYWVNKYIADATIFQSSWSKENNLKQGMNATPSSTIIGNAVDPEKFNKSNRASFSISRKVRLIAASWSNNPKKGFETLKWMDQNLNWDKYEMTFIGNSPIIFENITMIEPVDSIKLAAYFKQHDIFIFPSEKESCSNILIEAMSCGLPALAINDGGNPEIIKKGGILFDEANEIPYLLQKIETNYSNYQANINLPSIREIGNKYLAFIEEVIEEQTTPKKLSKADVLLFKSSQIIHKILSKI